MIAGLTLSRADDSATTEPTTRPARHHHAASYTAPQSNGELHGVLGGGSRGAEELPMPRLYVPAHHMGLTSRAQPTLFYYLPKATPNKVVITLMNFETKESIQFPPSDGVTEAGRHQVDLASIGKSLQPGVEYLWTVYVRATNAGPSHNALVGAFLRYDPASPELIAQLAGKDPADQAGVFAENHFWFDAIAADVEGMTSDPGDASLQDQFKQTLAAGQCDAENAK